MLMLAIESSCDETSCAIVRDGVEILSCATASQIAAHQEYGGVFPEVASRLHIENISLVIKDALKTAQISLSDIQAIAVTQGPGLIGSLHVGIMAAKTLAWSLGIPLVPVDHIAGHIYANRLAGDFTFPLLALVVSGGHSELVYMAADYQFQILGATLDDAVGEAYDKVARLLGLGYPGGPVLDRLAQTGKKNYQLPLPKTEGLYDFSFSGLKSAVRQLLLRCERNSEPIIIEDVAYAFQHACVEALMSKVKRALADHPVATLVLAGGVAANSLVRHRILEFKAFNPDVKILIPPVWACMDQAAMIGIAGSVAFSQGIRGNCELSAIPNKHL